jgi:hypothetical protein
MVAIVFLANPDLHGQTIDRITSVTSPGPLVALPDHHPQWANKQNSTGLVPPGLPLEQLTLVLSRSPQQEAALQTFLAQQQESGSPNYHRWLTPAEMGERFGLSEHDLATLSGWLQSQGLHVNWVSPSRIFLRFGGTAGAVDRAFQTELHTYGSAATKYGTDLVMADIKRDGAPHTAVGIEIEVDCRVGKSTAYPHPNQFLHNKITRGQAIQIEGGVNIAGCGGELYRAMFIHPVTDQMKKLWTVSRDSCLMQKEESVAGVTGSTVAYKIFKHQVKEGVAPYIYHRPGHGQGWEGHQPPYLSLGDYTMLEPGMSFSVEPGLYDPEHGFGANFSDDFVIEPQGPSRQMSRLPWSEEWCFVKI